MEDQDACSSCSLCPLFTPQITARLYLSSRVYCTSQEDVWYNGQLMEVVLLLPKQGRSSEGCSVSPELTRAEDSQTYM